MPAADPEGQVSVSKKTENTTNDVVAAGITP
jgi:hypothetical protein